MSPEELRDALAARVARLEANVDRMKADLENLRSIPVETARLAEKVVGIEAHLSRVEHRLEQRLDELEALLTREKQQDRQDSKNLRNILIGVGIAAVLSPIGAILAALALQ